MSEINTSPSGTAQAVFNLLNVKTKQHTDGKSVIYTEFLIEAKHDTTGNTEVFRVRLGDNGLPEFVKIDLQE